MRNHRVLLARVARWLRPGGRAFFHHFSHRWACYRFEDEGEDDWMARHFFSGGVMPPHDLVPWTLAHGAAPAAAGAAPAPLPLAVRGHWWLNGLHYSRTLEDWLRRHDATRGEWMPAFAAPDAYGSPAEARRWDRRWRVFYLACSELFAWGGGDTWGVTHVVLERTEG